MKITQVRLGRLSVPLRVPFKTALRTVNSVEDIVVELHTDTGAIGYGEAPPTGPITGDTAGGIVGAIRELIAPVILNQEVDDFEALTARVQKAGVHNTSAKAAVDMALWDLYGQLHHIPVHKLLGGARRTLVTDITISVNPPEEMARDALDAVARGYDCLKVKVGADPALDTARLAAVRKAVGDDVCIRIDANQAWTPRQAVRILNEMQDKGLALELVEQPVPAADLEGLAYVTRNSWVPVIVPLWNRIRIRPQSTAFSLDIATPPFQTLTKYMRRARDSYLSFKKRGKTRPVFDGETHNPTKTLKCLYIHICYHNANE